MNGCLIYHVCSPHGALSFLVTYLNFNCSRKNFHNSIVQNFLCTKTLKICTSIQFQFSFLLFNFCEQTKILNVKLVKKLIVFLVESFVESAILIVTAILCKIMLFLPPFFHQLKWRFKLYQNLALAYQVYKLKFLWN